MAKIFMYYDCEASGLHRGHLQEIGKFKDGEIQGWAFEVPAQGRHPRGIVLWSYQGYVTPILRDAEEQKARSLFV